MSRLLVVGLGNDFRGDDAAGLLAARAVAKLTAGQVDVVENYGDAWALAESMTRHDEVVVVDAVRRAGVAGAVVELAPDALARRGATSCHGLGLADAIALARALGSHAEIHVFGIAGETFELGAAPTPAVTEAAHDVATRIKERFECA